MGCLSNWAIMGGGQYLWEKKLFPSFLSSLPPFLGDECFLYNCSYDFGVSQSNTNYLLMPTIENESNKYVTQIDGGGYRSF